MKSLAEIKATLEQNKDKLYSSYPLKSLAIFGSFARNEEKEGSDLDILVEFHDKIGIRFIDLANELEKLMELKIDLVSKKWIKKRYLQSIEEDLIPILNHGIV